jgi:hypothetical protein
MPTPTERRSDGHRREGAGQEQRGRLGEGGQVHLHAHEDEEDRGEYSLQGSHEILDLPASRILGEEILADDEACREGPHDRCQLDHAGEPCQDEGESEREQQLPLLAVQALEGVGGAAGDALAEEEYGPQEDQGHGPDPRHLGGIHASRGCDAHDQSEQQEPQNVVDHGGAQDHAGLGGLDPAEVLEDTRRDAHAGGTQGRRHEEVGGHAVFGQQARTEHETEGKRDEDPDGGHQTCAGADAAHLGDAGLQPHHEGQEQHPEGREEREREAEVDEGQSVGADH